MIVVDSSAVIAILNQEPDAPLIARSLAAASRRLIGAATYLECTLVIRSKLGADGIGEFEGLSRRIRIEIIPFDEAQMRMAIDANLRYGRGSGHPAQLNFGDCFAYALARSRNLPLLFKGDDFIHTDVVPALKPA